MLLVPYLILTVLSVFAIVPWLVLLTLVTVPQALLLVRFVSSGVRGKVLSRAVRGTSLLHLTFGIALAIGYLLGWMFP